MDDLMDEQMRMMDRQMSMFDRQFAEVQSRMDNFDSVFAEARRQEQEAYRDAERALRGQRSTQSQPSAAGNPNVKIQRREERAPGSYRYYESIEIRGGGSGAYMSSTNMAAGAPLISPALFVATLLAGAFAAVTANFHRNYGLTTFSEASRWKLLLLWPVLALSSKRFRQQFLKAIRGVEPTKDPSTGNGSDRVTGQFQQQRQQQPEAEV